jgi:hypothetical protein
MSCWKNFFPWRPDMYELQRIRRNRVPLDSSIHADAAPTATGAPAKLALTGAPYVHKASTRQKVTIRAGAFNALQASLLPVWGRQDQMHLRALFAQVSLKVHALTTYSYAALAPQVHSRRPDTHAQAVGKDTTLYIVIAAPRFDAQLEARCRNCIAGKFSEASDATECTCKVEKYINIG